MEWKKITEIPKTVESFEKNIEYSNDAILLKIKELCIK